MMMLIWEFPGLSEYEIYRTDEKNIRKTAEMLKLLK